MDLLKTISVFILLALLALSHIINIAFTPLIPSSSLLLSSLAAICVILSMIALQRRWNEVEQKLLMIAIGGGLLIIILLCWNFLFREYILTTNFQHDIFRGAFRTNYAPLYGIDAWDPWQMFRYVKEIDGVLFLLLFVGVFTIRVIFWSNSWIEDQKFWFELLVWFTGLLMFFPLPEGLIGFTDSYSNYQGFWKDLYLFDNYRDILENYTQQMFNLQGRNGHYPPGNILLLKIGQDLGIKWFGHAVVIFLTILTLIPLNGIGTELQIPTYVKNVAMVLFISAQSILLIPTHDLTPITMFFSTTAIWLTLRVIRQESLSESIVVGCIMAILTYFSFISFVVGGLMIVIVLTQVFSSRPRILILFRNAGVAILSFLVIYLVYYLITGFNIYECYMVSIKHNRSGMGTGLDSFARYSLRSTGNLIAWLFSIGFPAATFGIISAWKVLRHKLENPWGKAEAFTAAVVITVFLAGFSSLFFLETERIWIFFVPPWMIVSAIALSDRVSENNRGRLVKSLLVFSIIMVTGVELYFIPSLISARFIHW